MILIIRLSLKLFSSASAPLGKINFPRVVGSEKNEFQFFGVRKLLSFVGLQDFASLVDDFCFTSFQ
jgi:hypothetical protein